MLKTDLVGRLDNSIIIDINSVKGTKKKSSYISGIYKITSPSGRVYIGQAIDIELRLYIAYKQVNCKQQQLIYNSIIKHGKENHLFEIIHIVSNIEIAKDELIKVLNGLEESYIIEFKSFVDDCENGLNLSRGGHNKSHSIQSKKKISEANKGKIVKPETREKIRKARTGSKSSPEANKKNSEARLGEKNHFFGKNHTDEAKNKMSIWRKENQQGENHPFYGKHHTDETKKKIGDSKKGLKMSDEVRIKQSERNKGSGNPMYGSARFGELNPMYGKKQSEETKQKIREKKQERDRIKKENNLKNKNNGKN